VTLLGEREAIKGAGRALPQSGFRVLLQPARRVRGTSARSHSRESMGYSLMRINLHRSELQNPGWGD
jgi:hypothetical protein